MKPGEGAIDEGIEESFPASDPVSVNVTKVVKNPEGLGDGGGETGGGRQLGLIDGEAEGPIGASPGRQHHRFRHPAGTSARSLGADSGPAARPGRAVGEQSQRCQGVDIRLAARFDTLRPLEFA